MRQSVCKVYDTMVNLVTLVDFEDRRSDFDVPHTKEKLPTNGAEIHMIFEQPFDNRKLFVGGIILQAKQNLISLCTYILLA